MASTPDPIPLIGPSDMQVVERVLDMRSGYVLDLNNREFDVFIAHEVGIDATAPRYSTDGNSKAKRLRRIPHSLHAAQQAKLLDRTSKRLNYSHKFETRMPSFP